MGRKFSVGSKYRPTVVGKLNVGGSFVDHRFHGEHHTGLDARIRTAVRNVRYGRVFVNVESDAVPAVFVYDTVTGRVR